MTPSQNTPVAEADREADFVREVASELEAFNPTIHHATPERHHLDRALLALWEALARTNATRPASSEPGRIEVSLSDPLARKLRPSKECVERIERTSRRCGRPRIA
jgi:hypothetical protein